MKDIKVIKRTLDQCRRDNVRLISMNNSEWYSLFRDEIRNSIAIEGIFANRSELLSVLEGGERTTDQKTTASHVLFETIYPFRDGNGRVGRILLSYLLIGNGLINISIKGTKTADRNAYYRALETGGNEIEQLLRRIEKGETPTVARINKAMVRSQLEPLKSIILERLNYSLNRVEIDVKTLDREALIPLRDAARFYNYSQDYLRQLIHLGKLPAQKRGKLWVVRVRDMIKYKQSTES